MKKLLLTTLFIFSALTPFVIAACPSPNYPECPGPPTGMTTMVDTWTCCDMTRACSTDGTKHPRFLRSQGIAVYVVGSQFFYCVWGGYSDSGEINCCD